MTTLNTESDFANFFNPTSTPSVNPSPVPTSIDPLGINPIAFNPESIAVPNPLPVTPGVTSDASLFGPTIANLPGVAPELGTFDPATATVGPANTTDSSLLAQQVLSPFQSPASNVLTSEQSQLLNPNDFSRDQVAALAASAQEQFDLLDGNPAAQKAFLKELQTNPTWQRAMESLTDAAAPERSLLDIEEDKLKFNKIATAAKFGGFFGFLLWGQLQKQKDEERQDRIIAEDRAFTEEQNRLARANQLAQIQLTADTALSNKQNLAGPALTASPGARLG